MSRYSVPGLLLIALCCLSSAAPAAAQVADVITVGSVSAVGPAVDVPVYIRDVSASSLGIDRPAGSRIQSFSIKINYPAASIQSITFTRAGITAGLTPTLELSPSAPGSISLLATFPEASQLIPFVSNAAAPGNLIGHLTVTLAAAATPGTNIVLTLDPTLTQLTDEGGNGLTKESVASSNLVLVNGAINVLAPGDVPTLNACALALVALAFATIGAIVIR
jgi:hypothetical protein